MHTHFVRAVRRASLAVFTYFSVDKQEADLNRKLGDHNKKKGVSSLAACVRLASVIAWPM